MANELVINFWKRVEEMIITKNITLKKLSDDSGIAYESLRSYRRFGSEPSVTNAYVIAKALGVSIDYLLTGETDKNVATRVINLINIQNIETKLDIKNINQILKRISERLDEPINLAVEEGCLLKDPK